MAHKSGETLDTIRDAKIYQAEDGYRFSIDVILLESFVRAKKNEKGIELGAGSGIISILLARRFKHIELKAVEIQRSLVRRARKNVRINGLEDRIEIIHRDMKGLKDIYHTNSFDFVVSNPPFRKTKTGHICSSEERAIARHELKIDLPSLINIVSFILKHNGRFYMIYHPSRLVELIHLLKAATIEPKRMRFVHGRRGEEAKMVLIEAAKGGRAWLKIEPPIYVYGRGDSYSAEVKKMLAS